MPPMLPYPILEVDLVLVEQLVDEREYVHAEDEFSCMVTCPTCGTVNEHGLDYISLEGQWGHRVCDGYKYGRLCEGYELMASPQMKLACFDEWRKLTRPMDKKRTKDFRAHIKKNQCKK